jgi:phosphatidylglycerol lysyltransferase
LQMTATARARILSALPILIGLVVLLAAFRFIGSVLNTTSPAAVIDRLRAADIGVILQSCAFTAASFLLLCGYDVLALRLVGRAFPLRLVAGIAAMSYAFSQALGFGTLIGGAVRYRLYSRRGVPAPEIAAPGGLALPGIILDLVLLISRPHPVQARTDHTPSGTASLQNRKCPARPAAAFTPIVIR